MIMTSRIVKGGPLALDSISRLLLIQSGDIGDLVLSTPSISALRQRFPQSKITIAVRRKAKELMDDCPLIDEVLVVDKMTGSGYRQSLSTAHQIRLWRKARFDLAIDLRTGTRGAIMAWICGAPRRISFYSGDEAHWRNWVFTHLAIIPYVAGTYVADYYHFLLEAFEISDRPGPLRLWINPERQQRVDRFCWEKGLDPLSPYIALQPFSQWPYKELPDERYIQLIEMIHSAVKVPVVIVGGPEDKQRAAGMCSRLGHEAINLAGETTIGELSALLARSRLFVGIDSAGLHIAAAVGCPTIGIFGPSASASWAPRGKGHLVVQAQEPCSPCRDKGCRNSEVSLCLQRLPANIIMVAIEKQVKFQKPDMEEK
ncbi:MAG: glycosyltransferase family 9 protein [Desulfobacterales bacterium]|nr:glycosyltransferase family 9 protein [Desulfobacterales bacterium]